jgi:hypothetical protein
MMQRVPTLMVFPVFIPTRDTHATRDFGLIR